MAERQGSQRPADVELEQALTELGNRLAYPPTPDLIRPVRARLARAPRRRTWTSVWSLARYRPAYAALVVLLVLVTGLLTLWPAARLAVAERLGLRGIMITYAPWFAVPTPSLGTGLQLGEPLSLAEARQRVPYRVLVPSDDTLGSPDEVYVGTPPPSGQVTLVYRARDGVPAATDDGLGILLSQFRGDVDPILFGKILGPGTQLERVTVDGALGYWIEGSPHLFLYRDQDGHIREESIRLARNTLLWQRGELTLRLESALSRDEALRIAATVR